MAVDSPPSIDQKSMEKTADGLDRSVSMPGDTQLGEQLHKDWSEKDEKKVVRK